MSKNIKILKMPSLSPTMETGKIVKWLKSIGDKIKQGEVVAEVETDKATIEMESGHKGILVKIVKEAGDEEIKVDEVIGIVAKEGTDQTEIDSFVNSLNAVADNPTGMKLAAQTDEAKTQETSAPSAPVPEVTRVGGLPKSPYMQQSAAPKASEKTGRIIASPYAKAIARGNDVDLSMIEGTGAKGNIVARDVENFISSGGANINQNAISSHSGNNVSINTQPILNKMSGMRKAISNKVCYSKQTIPHFYVSISIDLTKLLEYKQQLFTSREIKTTVNDWFILATAKTLLKVPQINQVWEVENESLLQYSSANINCALDVGNGPLLVLIPDAEKLTLTQIHEKMKELTQKAKDNTISPGEIGTGTFSMSNLGMFGTHSFQAIINPPQVAVIAIGGADKNNQCIVNISCDHRALDGKDAAIFLKELKTILEEPIMLVV